MYEIDLNEKAQKLLFKLKKKNTILFMKVRNKIKVIQNNPDKKYKFLKGNYKNLNRVHVANHFVLVFEIKHSEKRIVIHSFKHHDEAYK